MNERNHLQHDNRLSFHILVLLIGVPLCLASAEVWAQQLKIGFAAPLTGPYAHLGHQMKSAAEDAQKVINDAGGVLGQKLELVIQDDACDPRQGRMVAARFVHEKVDAVIGHCPHLASAVAEVYESSRTIFISTSPVLTSLQRKSYRYVFRLGIWEDNLTIAAADSLDSAAPRENTVGIVGDGSPFSVRAAVKLGEELHSKRRTVVFNEQIREPGRFLAQMNAKHPDIVVFMTLDPSWIVKLHDGNPSRAMIVVLGLPETSNASWKEFWAWAAGSRVEAYVLAPAALGGPEPGAPPSTPLGGIVGLWSRRIRADDAPTIAQVYLFSAFDLLTQAIVQAGRTGPDAVENALRVSDKETLLGSLRADRTGEIGPIPYRMYEPSMHWSPSSAFLVDCCEKSGLPTMARPSRSSVYNIEIDNKESADPIVLKHNQRTEVSFYIGPFSEESVAPGIEPSPLLDAIAGNKPLELTVTLFCNLSETDTFQLKKIVFDPREGRSEVARFEILPSEVTGRRSNGPGHLIFVVDAKGYEIDVIRVNAFVGPPSEEDLKRYTPPAKLELGQLDIEEVYMPDLIVSFTPESSGRVQVVLRPFDERLKAHIQNAVGGSGREYWIFNSGVSNHDMEDLAQTAYRTMRAIVEQNNQRLQQVYRSLGEAVPIGPGGSRLQFSPDECEAMLEALRRQGAYFYTRLFLDGDSKLRSAVEAIDSFHGGKQLKVRIVAENVYAPWQILYPGNSGSIDPGRFWGFRYELGTLQLVNAVQGRVKTVMPMPIPKEVLFGTWRRTGPQDEIAERAEILLDHLKKNIGEGITPADKRDDFLSRIESGAKDLKLIFVYGHASSGSELVVYALDSDEPTIVEVPTIVGPSIIFARDELLTPEQIDMLNPRSRPHFLESQPIIILNACETGTSGIREPNNNGFVGVLTRAGARALFVTEAPVWSNFAQHFGSDLIDRLLEGDEVQTALLKVRRKHLLEWKNPLGLLYSLYGNQGARIKKAASGGPQ